MSAIIIAVGGLKGGVGKTTLTVNLAGALYRSSHKTAIVDCDQQGTCRVWAERAASENLEGPPVYAIAPAALRRDVAQLAEELDVIVIDSPPRLGTAARAAMLVADLVLLPTLPSGPDIWALQESVALLQDARSIVQEKTGAYLPARILLNRVESRTNMSRTAREALDNMGERVCATQIGNRVAYAATLTSGTFVLDANPSGVEANEMRALVRELLAAVGEGSSEVIAQ